MEIGQAIKALRQKQELSQIELACRMGATQRMISSWERNDSRPTNINEKKIAKALNCSVEDIYKESFEK